MKSTDYFCSNPADRQTDRHKHDRLHNLPTSLTEVINKFIYLLVYLILVILELFDAVNEQNNGNVARSTSRKNRNHFDES